MKIEKTAAIAEIVSSIAILATLAFFVLEMRQNTTAIQGSTRQAMAADDRELIFQLINLPNIYSGLFGESELTDEELVQLNLWIAALVRSRESQWLQFESGVIDEATWATYFGTLRFFLSQRGGAKWWNRPDAQSSFNPGFVSHVNQILSEPLVQPISADDNIVDVTR